jgi:peptidoglycan/LPS O-acetylase OafA/YrhL
LSEARNVGLDGLRGVAALIVVLRHTLNAIPVAPGLLKTLIESPVAVLLNAQGAVQLFFVLSGFVLASSLDHGRDGPLARRLPAFFAKRILRIHLPYVAAVLISWLVAFGFIASQRGPTMTGWIAAGTNVQLGFAELLSTLVFPGSALGLVPQGWTLAIEMVYSLALPLFFWIGRRSWLALVGLSLLGLYLAPPEYRGLYYAIDFSLGVALYCERQRVSRWLSGLWPVSSLVLLAIGLFLFAAPMVLGWSVWVPEYGFFVSGGHREEILLMGLGSTLLVALAYANPSYASALSWRPFAFLGRISFSLYLLHRGWITFLAPRIDTGTRELDVVLLYAGVIALSIASSVVFERLFDRPSIQAGRLVSGWISRTAREPRPSRRPER